MGGVHHVPEDQAAVLDRIFNGRVREDQHDDGSAIIGVFVGSEQGGIHFTQFRLQVRVQDCDNPGFLGPVPGRGVSSGFQDGFEGFPADRIGFEVADAAAGPQDPQGFVVHVFWF